uniref:NACHT domain-containing protein n=1 Tax=Oryzias latipes TaxID=8090 RepID=A0A3B3HVX0_ORYLA
MVLHNVSDVQSGEAGEAQIFTELWITEEQREDIQTQHEVRQLEANNIFRSSPDHHGSIRVVLTNGVAGAGKTFLVQKFTLDWAEGLEDQDISAVVPLPFRELNLIREEQHSLLTLIQMFHPIFQKIPAEQLSVCKLLFIFDGLDESRLSLDFNNGQVVSDVTQKSSVNVLLTNLIQGRLLPSALVWITSRPAAANQIPPSCVSRVTEVRGFTDSQKEEYFRRRFKDGDLSSRILSYIKASRSLFNMCELPIFCWITAGVLEDRLTTEQRGELPTTLTDLYSHFLMLTEADREVLLKLGRLALEHLEKGNTFYQEDLQQCGLDVTEASVFSGVCTEILRRDCGIFQKAVYSFVHQSVQEFLSAVYTIHRSSSRNTENVLREDKHVEPKLNIFTEQKLKFSKKKQLVPPLDGFLSKVMKKSLRRETGHLDLFVCFLHGLSVKSSRILKCCPHSPETIGERIPLQGRDTTCRKFFPSQLQTSGEQATSHIERQMVNELRAEKQRGHSPKALEAKPGFCLFALPVSMAVSSTCTVLSACHHRPSRICVLDFSFTVEFGARAFSRGEGAEVKTQTRKEASLQKLKPNQTHEEKRFFKLYFVLEVFLSIVISRSACHVFSLQ